MKSSTFVLPHARFITGYTGLARIGNEPMEQVLGESLLNSACSAGFLPTETITAFAGTLTRRFTDPKVTALPPVHRRLTVMFTGYLDFPPNLSGKAPVAALVTNFQDWGAADRAVPFPAFKTTFIQMKKGEAWPTYVERIGSWGVLGPTEAAAIRALLTPGRPPHAVVDKIVSMLRTWSSRSPTIGEQANSCILSPDWQVEPVWTYHSAENSRTWYGGNNVIATPETQIAISQPLITAHGDAPPLVVPPTGRRRPCPCGSGKQYRLCHGKAKH